MNAMTRRVPLALAALAAAWSSAAAQSSGGAAAATGVHACSLLTDAEVERLINRGRRAFGEPEVVSLLGGAGTACEYPVGAQVVLFSGPTSQRDLETLLQRFKKDKEIRHPVTGVGDRAYIIFPTPRDKYEDRVAYLVTFVGRHTVAVSMAAEDSPADGPMMEYCRRGQLSREECAELEAAGKGQTAESLQPAVVEVARAVVAKLR